MKILAIRGRNLASLADDFEVDFQSEPLASAGVFAITGPTGAGKSTLLDALSLALFHDTPRLSSAREHGVEIPDAGDSSISPQDPRNILRRGTGEGFAEVDFVGIDKHRWRARWEVRRARQKPGGKLQKASASLENLDQQQQHGGKIRETREIIERKAGLSYEQFCRSILLAQNEFSTFLRASGKERAELLEALTGTEIYRLISKLCHERAANEKKKLQTLETELGMDPPLSEQERTELEEKLSEAERHSADLQKRHDKINREATWHEQGRILKERQQALQKALADSKEELAGQSEELGLVRRMEAIEPARALHRDLEHASAALARHENTKAELDKAHKQAKADFQSAEKRTQKTRKEHEAAEQAQREQAPKIRKAREIDHKLISLVPRLDEQHDQARQVDRKIEEAEQRLSEARKTLDENQSTLTAWQTWQDENPGFKPALDQWAAAGQALKEASRTAEMQRAAEQALNRIEKKAETASSQIKSLESLLESARLAVKVAREHRKELEQREKTFDAESIEKEKEALDHRKRLLEQLNTCLAEEDRAIQALESTKKSLSELQSEQEHRKERLDGLSQAIPAAAEASSQARKAWQASRAIADQHTEALRQELVEGEPCPVCGSREHPGHKQGNEEIARLVEELAGQLEQAEQSYRELERERTGLDAEFAQADRQRQSLDEEMKLRGGQQKEAHEALQQAAKNLDLESEDPEKLKSLASTLSVTIENAREELNQRRTALGKARQELEQARQKETAAENDHDSAEQECESARKASAPVLDEKKDAVARLELQRQSERETIETVGQMIDLEQQPDAHTTGILLEAWRAGEKRRAAAELASEKQPLLEKQINDREDQITTWISERNGLAETAGDLQKTIESLRKERVDCLAQSDPDTLEEELNKAIQQAREDMSGAEAAYQDAHTRLTRAEAALEGWTKDLEAYRTTENHAKAALGAWLHERHSDEHVNLGRDDLETLLSLLATPADRWQPLRKQLRQLELDIRDHRTRAAGIADQLNDWESQSGISERDEASVKKALEEAAAELKAALRRAADLNADLGKDDQRQQRAAGQLEKIREQQQICEKWQKLNELIGASDGSRFRDYAQQFTLDVLITHANAQLKILSPRYRLQRGEANLNILVVDDDMGGEIRGVHSLSGGETFLASLALALGLAELSSQRVTLESLFIDEGFGSLDTDTLRVAMDALDRLQAQGRKVGVISHVQEMSDRIGTKIEVERTSPGRSRINVAD